MSACAAGLLLLQGAGGLIAVSLVADRLGRLIELRKGRLDSKHETESIAKFDVTLPYEDLGEVPVSLTLFKQHGRVRVLVLDHTIPREAVERIQEDIATALGGKIVSITSEAEEALIREAIDRVGPADAFDRRQVVTPVTKPVH